MNDISIIKHNELDTYENIVNLISDISKAMPSIVFKQEGDHINKYGIDNTKYPNGVVFGFNVYHDSDMNNPIGRVSLENYHSKTPKYCIQSVNIFDGRQTWGNEGQYKTSIHSKNIVRVAKKVFKPYTFQQIAMKNFSEFNNKVEHIRYNMTWEARQNTCHDFDTFANDLMHLQAIGYEPINPKIKAMMEYATTNKERLDKYLNYNPDYYFVLVKDNDVQYRLNKDKGQPAIVVRSKDDLPDNIKGKLFVLDITEGKDFVEDVGLKENNGAYWIIA